MTDRIVTILKDDNSVHQGVLLNRVGGMAEQPSGFSLASIVAATVHAARTAAATVYHDITTVEQNVTQWHADNPALAALVDQAVAVAQSSLTNLGVPVDAIKVVWSDIEAALKLMAAGDASVVGATSLTANSMFAPKGS
jgi:hypothetical protein